MTNQTQYFYECVFCTWKKIETRVQTAPSIAHARYVAGIRRLTGKWEQVKVKRISRARAMELLGRV